MKKKRTLALLLGGAAALIGMSAAQIAADADIVYGSQSNVTVKNEYEDLADYSKADNVELVPFTWVQGDRSSGSADWPIHPHKLGSEESSLDSSTELEQTIKDLKNRIDSVDPTTLSRENKGSFLHIANEYKNQTAEEREAMGSEYVDRMVYLLSIYRKSAFVDDASGIKVIPLSENGIDERSTLCIRLVMQNKHIPLGRLQTLYEIQIILDGKPIQAPVTLKFPVEGNITLVTTTDQKKYVEIPSATSGQILSAETELPGYFGILEPAKAFSRITFNAAALTGCAAVGSSILLILFFFFRKKKKEIAALEQ